MKNWITQCILFSILLASFSSFADVNETLNLDRPLPQDIELSFPNPDNINPQISDFEINNAIPMSSESGERWCLLTIHNNSRGNRTLTQNQLLAVLADGSRIFPAQFSQRFKANETLSVSIYFTKSQFPILQVISNSNRRN